MKTKFQFTNTVSGLRTTILNIKTSLFQMENKPIAYKYLSKQKAPNENAYI